MMRWTIAIMLTAFSPCLDGSSWAQKIPPGMALDTFASLTLASWSDRRFFFKIGWCNQPPTPQFTYLFPPQFTWALCFFGQKCISAVFPFTRPAMKPLWICGGLVKAWPRGDSLGKKEWHLPETNNTRLKWMVGILSRFLWGLAGYVSFREGNYEVPRLKREGIWENQWNTAMN